jgi:hypothetical protein
MQLVSSEDIVKYMITLVINLVKANKSVIKLLGRYSNADADAI